jgi:lipid-binding SYLF domain-containing protein
MKLIRFILLIASITFLSPSLYAKTAGQIDHEADLALKEFNREVKGSLEFVNDRVKGLLIFPSVVKAGIGVGGEYGEGVLRVDGKSIMYYSTASASIGFQFGLQQKSIIIAFLTDKALNDFRNKDGWTVGVDGSVALVNLGVGKDLNNATLNKSVIGFVFGNKGLMYNLTIEGTKFTKIVR